MKQDPRLVFAGTPAFAAQCLDALIHAGHSVVAVYTQPDRPAGRGRHLSASPVKQLAQQHHIPVCQPLNFKSTEAVTELQAWQADLMIVVAYGLLLPPSVLSLPSRGCINVHASILPRWRGAAPIHRALLAGDQHTGITLMQMDQGLDTGDKLMTATLDVFPHDTSGTLHDRLAQLGSELLLSFLQQPKDTITAIKQDHSLATYAHKLHKEEGLINWNQSACAIDMQIRGLNPWPVAYSHYEDLTVRIWQASVIKQSPTEEPGSVIEISSQGLLIACKQDCLLLEQIQLPGKRRVPVKDILHGQHPFKAMQRFI